MNLTNNVTTRYHQRFKSFEFVRGQEADHWKGVVIPKEERENTAELNKMFSDGGFWAPGRDPQGKPHTSRQAMAIQDAVNRLEAGGDVVAGKTEGMPQYHTFTLGMASAMGDWTLLLSM